MAPSYVALAVGAFALTARGESPSERFDQWAVEQDKHYATMEERAQAMKTFLSNDAIIQSMMQDNSAVDGAVYGHNEFSDLSPEDFKKIRFPYTMEPSRGLNGNGLSEAPIYLSDPPASVDWREKGAVTPIKNQASCGSCWAESAVGNIESAWYLANTASMKAPVSLSVQEVIECDPHDYACYGGFPKGAYEYVIEHGGLSSEESYPYNTDHHTICLANQTYNETCGDGMCDDPPLTSFCDQTCSDKAKTHKSVAHITSWVALTKGEADMAAYVAQHGPISVGIDASGSMGILMPWLQFYKKGVANPKWCTNKIDHGVLIVGYGVDGTTPYWIVKNSWGEKWGESGYFRLVRGEGKCGIALMATSAVVAKLEGPSTLVV